MREETKKRIAEAYRTVPLYLRNQEQLGVEAEELLEKDRWEDLPLLERNQIITNGTAVLTPWAVPLMMSNKLIYAQTSGSTGKYMEIYWKQEDYRKSMLPLWYYRYKYYGITPGMRMCYFYTIHSVGQEMKSYRQKNELGFSKLNLDMDRLYQIYWQMVEFQPEWMTIQPGMAMLLCRCMDLYGLEPICSLKYVEFTGEILTDEVRRTVEEYFGCQTANQYGANEFNSIAYECPCGNLHVLTSNVKVEVLDEAGRSITDEEGEVYVTSLTNSVMPLIRYRIGDRGMLCGEHERCSCGNHAPIFRLSSGRANDWIIAKDGEKITPNVLVRAFDCVNYRMDGVIRQFQAVQEDVGVFSVLLAVEEEDEYLEAEIEELFLESLEDDRMRRMEYKFYYQEELFPDEGTGKMKWFRNEMKERK